MIRLPLLRPDVYRSSQTPSTIISVGCVAVRGAVVVLPTPLAPTLLIPGHENNEIYGIFLELFELNL